MNHLDSIEFKIRTEYKKLRDAVGDTDYEVEAVLDERVDNRVKQYLVSWVGYGPADNSWEP